MSKTAMDFILTSTELFSSISHADEQTRELALQALRELQKKLAIDRPTLDALDRLLGVAGRGKDWSPELVRNNIFKVAHSLELDLPSSSF